MSNHRSASPTPHSVQDTAHYLTDGKDLRVFDPMRATFLERLQQALGYHFHQPAILDLALTHSSVAYEKQAEHHPSNDNEQLEFLGDAVLGLVVTERLFRAYPEFSEGAWTRLRAQFVSRKHLTSVAQTVHLGDFLRLGKGEEKSGGRKKDAILANAVEAVIAAVYLDGGLPPTVRLVRTWLLDQTLEAVVAAARVGEVGDYKSMLQEYFQAHGLGQPSYQVTSETGPDHRKNFVVAVALPGGSEAQDTKQILASATGMRKKHAEQEAARVALLRLREDRSTSVPPLTGYQEPPPQEQ
ncbi:MAG: ribonuclease III [Acidobacteriaceae bacterium]